MKLLKCTFHGKAAERWVQFGLYWKSDKLKKTFSQLKKVKEIIKIMVLNMKLYASFPEKQQRNQTKCATHRVFFVSLFYWKQKILLKQEKYI